MKAILKYLALYAFIFNPILSIGNIGVIKFLYPFLFYSLLKGSLSKMLKTTAGVRVMFIIIILYVMIRTLCGADSTFLYVSVVTLIEVCILPLYILRITEKDDLFQSLVYIGIVASLISFLCFFVPQCRQLIDGLQMEEDTFEFFSFRGFGFAEGRTFYYSITLAVILIIGLIHFKTKIISILFLPFFLLGICFNARIGIVALLLGFVIVFLYYRVWRKPLLWVIVPCVISVLGWALVKYIGLDSDSLEFAKDGLYQISDLLFGTSKAMGDTYGALEQAVVLPNNISSWLFGDGYSVMKEVRNCDTGWNNQLIYGGIIYMILIYTTFMKQWFNSVHRSNIFVMLFLLGVIVISNLKGNLMSTNGTYRLIMLIMFYYQMSSQSIIRRDNNQMYIRNTLVKSKIKSLY